MKYTKEQKFVLFILGKLYDQINSNFKRKPVNVTFSKIQFINLLQEAKITEKSQRALYKNLEVLEEKKLIEYSKKSLRLTMKGNLLYKKVKKEIEPFLRISKLLGNKIKLKKYVKGQTRFK